MNDHGLLNFDDPPSLYMSLLHNDSSMYAGDGIHILDLDSAETLHLPNANSDDTIYDYKEVTKTSEFSYDGSIEKNVHYEMNNVLYDINADDEFEDIALIDENLNNDTNEDVECENECNYEDDEGFPVENEISSPITPNLPPFTTTFGRGRYDSEASDDSGYDSPLMTEEPKKKRKRSKVMRLWEFLADVLGDERYCPVYLDWIDKSKGIFRFKQSKKVAELWGEAKNKKKMPYEHLSRALRHYYKHNILYRIPHRRLVYQFGPNATGWRVRAKIH